MGLIYSLIFPLLGGRYLYFFPFISGLHSLWLAGIGGALFLLAHLLIPYLNRVTAIALILVMLSSHYLYWIMNYSLLVKWNLATHFAISSLTWFALVALCTGLFYLNSYFPGQRLVILVALFLGVIGPLGLKLTALNVLPDRTIDRLVGGSHTDGSTQYDFARNLFYPLSYPLEKRLKNYSSFLPKPPGEDKVFVLVLDAFRDDFLGKKLSGMHLTPNMSRLAERYNYFPDYRVQSNWTKPSVASFFTGRYVRDHATFIGVGKIIRTENTEKGEHYGHALPKSFDTLAERLQETGYTNAGFTTIPHISSRYQFDQGFNYYRKLESSTGNGDMTLLRSMLFWVMRNQPESSFIYLHMKGPHYPYNAAARNKKFWKRTRFSGKKPGRNKQWNLPDIPDLIQRQLPENTTDINYEKDLLRHLYGAELLYYDQVVLAQLIRSLQQLDVFKSSTIVLTSDHGEGLYDHDRYFGHGLNLYEEAINVPLIMKLPNDEQQQRRSLPTFEHWNVESIDLTATLLDLANSSRGALPGDSLVPWIKEPSRNHPFQTAFSEKTWVNSIRKVSVVKGNSKYIYDYFDESGELFDLSDDPHEQKSLKSNSDRERQLKQVIFDQLGADTSLRRQPSTIRGASRDELEELEGLGYF